MLVIAGGMMLLAIIILLIVLVTSKKKKRDVNPYDDIFFSSVSSGGRSPNSGNGGNVRNAGNGRNAGYDRRYEEPFYADERTVDENARFHPSFDDERTIAAQDSGLRLLFRISFQGRNGTAERILTNDLIIGRGRDCDVDVVFGMKNDDAKETSRAHAVILLHQNGLFIRDNQSRNGTVLNGRKISSTMQLKDGDTLQLGKAYVKVEIVRHS